MTEARARALAWLLTVAFALALAVVARASSLTVDEASVIPAGFSDIEHHEVVFFPEQAPLARFTAGLASHAVGASAGDLAVVTSLARADRREQWAQGERFLFDANRPDAIVLAARLACASLSVAGAVAVWLWASRRFGAWGGLAALALFVANTDVLGHGALATADAPFAASAAIVGCLLDRVASRGGRANVVLLGGAVGLLLGAKLSAPATVVAFALGAALLARQPIDPEPASFAHPLGAGPLAARARASALGTLAVVALAYGTLGVLFLGREPLGLYLAGTRAVRAIHHAPYAGYLLGTSATGRWWHYGTLVLALKTPLPLLAAFALAAWAFARERATRGTAGEEAILHLPPLAHFAVTSLLAAPLGSRYFLLVVPFLCVSSGRLAVWARGSRARASVVGALVLLALANAAWEMPFPASAANVFAGSRERRWRSLDGPNVDWGGGLEALGEWQRSHEVGQLRVVPFGNDVLPGKPGAPPFAVTFAEGEPWVARLEAANVSGVVASARALFEPEPGQVYAVSAHVLAHAWAIDRAWGERAPGDPRLVLGKERAPDAVVGGGFLVFDLRH